MNGSKVGCLIQTEQHLSQWLSHEAAMPREGGICKRQVRRSYLERYMFKTNSSMPVTEGQGSGDRDGQGRLLVPLGVQTWGKTLPKEEVLWSLSSLPRAGLAGTIQGSMPKEGSCLPVP